MSYKLTLVASSVVLALSPSLHAQDDFSVFDEVVVSGTRSEQSIKNIPSSVSKVSSEDIEQNLSTDIKQALKYEPGVQVNGQGRFGMEDFTVRGMSGSRVKVLVDGVEQPSSYNPGADVMRKNANTFEVDTLTAIEVNKGPTSTLYGSDALGGTVLMRTKNPEDLLGAGDDTHVGLKTGYASANDEYKATVEVANRTGDLDTMLIYTYRDGNETETHGDGADILGPERGAADPYKIESHNILAKVFYQINAAHRIGVTGEYYTRDAKGDILSGEGRDGGMPGYIYTNVHGKDKDNRYRLGFEHEWQADFTAFETLGWSLNWTESESEHNSFDHTEAKGNRNRARSGKDESLQFDLQMQKAIELATSRHEFTYGATASNDKFKLSYTDYNLDTGVSTPGSEEVPSSESEQRAVFVQDQMFFMDDRMVVTAGLRYDDYKATPDSSSGLEQHNSDALTSRLGAVYHWNNNLSTYAQYSEGFRSPTIYEMYYDKDNSMFGYRIEANPDLKPEESQSYEVGIRANNHLGSVELAVFYNDYKNFISSKTTMDGSVEVTRNENIGKARIYGSEFKGSLWLDEAFGAPMGSYARLSMAYLDGEDRETGNTLDTIAPFTTVVGVGYDAPSDAWGTALTVTAVAAKDEWEEADNLKAPSYTVVDLTGYYRPTQDLTLRAGLFNAFDEKYWQYQDLEGATASTQGIDRRTQPGRNWGINLDYAF
ncbi:TonB-dependent hemoglobin/transferrin/lactoferrin family receptor [Photobacterium gaetbulicola]|uniref:Heme receptor n=1 Tax=Photobacterium gaetbulicola Gung47 TaxID=658445 RepID=A0A0C5WP45_9GAMM|nr:TonB-dependent hemoglobin/transferrin/lactoferrin family receptor [Photobacterium gaetbulicola]AJR08913.1 heme receptor [Photobacterium gaetbulicola Gung47]PSU13466.1 TonB-dependent hemoglobin/transferrin/lactoferrin family receptor [Photobacterium gaetbulicola]